LLPTTCLPAVSTHPLGAATASALRWIILFRGLSLARGELLLQFAAFTSACGNGPSKDVQTLDVWADCSALPAARRFCTYPTFLNVFLIFAGCLTDSTVLPLQPRRCPSHTYNYPTPPRHARADPATPPFTRYPYHGRDVPTPPHPPLTHFGRRARDRRARHLQRLFASPIDGRAWQRLSVERTRQPRIFDLQLGCALLPTRRDSALNAAPIC